MSGFISIAVDGPAAAGKSSLAENIAKKLGFIYLKTGWLYRAVGYFAYKNNIESINTAAIEELIERVNAGLEELKPELIYYNGMQKIHLNGHDISAEINTEKIGRYASDISKIKKVRDFLLTPQREAAQKYNTVLEGRDIGTVILPDANVKIFLTASPEARALRRSKDENRDYKQILKEITERDRQDTDREIAPLKPAEDAVILDNSNLEAHQTLEAALKIIKEKLPNVDIR
ncbi:MAG: (d)CMP kinase [Oscillospiraceae bacterium]|nr:(d)CMP kinase [Oscillospiraceae bacterium]